MSDQNARNRGSITHAVAAQVRAERAASGLTQRQVMAASGLPKSTYLRMESGERVADVGQLAAFCAAVNLPLSVLLSRAEERVAADGPRRDADLEEGLSSSAADAIEEARGSYPQAPDPDDEDEGGIGVSGVSS